MICKIYFVYCLFALFDRFFHFLPYLSSRVALLLSGETRDKRYIVPNALLLKRYVHFLFMLKFEIIFLITYYHRSVSDRFNIGKATALRAVDRVINALFLKAPIFIKWPIGDYAAGVMRGFEEASGFPRIIGAIDGTHIKIDAPKENAVDYINRKGYHSVHLQVTINLFFIAALFN